MAPLYARIFTALAWPGAAVASDKKDYTSGRSIERITRKS